MTIQAYGGTRPCQGCKGVGYVVYEKEGMKTVRVCPYCNGRKYAEKMKFGGILDQRVRDFARRSLFYVDAGESITKATSAMRENGVESILVRKDGKPVGILTIKDVVFKVVSKGLDPNRVLVSSAMSSPVITIGIDDTMKNAFEIMERNDLRRILVLGADGEPYGLLVLEHLVGDLM